ncbi:hypothetical protein UPYG_G00326490 [Umbra pygmaea]|uniref:Immunoglobulin V-set domain-containing protein n=1 Tax=Umbra pygmaea TaxID=75934 RepID=A0ABD0WGP0_UMBPY
MEPWHTMSHTASDLQMSHHLSLLLLLIFSRLSAVVNVKTGGSITTPCPYEQKYTSHVKYWCKGYYWNYCKYAARTDDSKSRGRTLISDDIKQRVFTVTMTDVDQSDYGYYWCAVEINGGSDIRIKWFYLTVNSVKDQTVPAHITVNQHATTMSTTNCKSETQTPANPQPSVSSTSGPVVKASSKPDEENTTQVSEERKEEEHHQWLFTIRLADIKYPLILLGLLVLLIAGVLVAWKMWRKHCDNKASDQSTSSAPDPFNEDVIYSTMVIKMRTQQSVQTNADPVDNVVYSSVARQTMTQADPDDNVVYSSVAQQITTQQKGSSIEISH